MFLKLKGADSAVVRPRVTPNPTDAAELERRISALAYNPSNGFHRDQQQGRKRRPFMRLVLTTK